MENSSAYFRVTSQMPNISPSKYKMMAIGMRNFAQTAEYQSAKQKLMSGSSAVELQRAEEEYPLNQLRMDALMGNDGVTVEDLMDAGEVAVLTALAVLNKHLITDDEFQAVTESWLMVADL